MGLRHIRARLHSIYSKSPVWAEHYTQFTKHTTDDVKLINPVFCSTVIENCIKLEIPRVAELIRQSIICSASGDRLIKKFPTPYVMYAEVVDIPNKEHIILCYKAKHLISCLEYHRLRKSLRFASIVFERKEFEAYERVLGSSFLAKPVTLKPVPEIVHLKTIVRLEGKHRKQQLHDAKGIAQYVYRLATANPDEPIKLKDYTDELSSPLYNVSAPAITASWNGLPSYIKLSHRHPERRQDNGQDK